MIEPIFDRRGVLAAGVALAATLVRPGSARAAPTPLRVVDDRLYLPARINGIAVEALLDSAAETSIVDAAFAVRLGLDHGEAVTARGTGAATAAARLVGGVTLDVAGLTLTSATVGVIDLTDVARRLGHGPIALIVGRDLFDAARLAIDIGRATLAVVPREIAPAGVRLPLGPRRGIEQVPVVVEGVPATADFDLGNGGTVLVGAAFAARHRLLADRATATIPGGGIGGETQQTTFTLRSLGIAGAAFADVPVAIDASPTAADVNVGVRLLRHFVMTVDFAQHALWLDRRQ